MPGQTCDTMIAQNLMLRILRPSMEGRTIARPDQSGCGEPATRRRLALQWRAGQLPGQTCLRRMSPITLPRARRPSMEGRTIARPDQRAQVIAGATSLALQWRAGQLPGQTRRDAVATSPHLIPSMEGRTIARPETYRCTPPSMEGRTAARLDKLRATLLPSMEGRTIARPDSLDGGRRRLQWRAGQLPGHPPLGRTSSLLQWRAGQLPGQTCLGGSFNGDNSARQRRRRSKPFNGGPDNCPARRVVGATSNRRRLLDQSLQWRAGQLPGQTWPASLCAYSPAPVPSMEGRTIARPDSGGSLAVGKAAIPSMEGRTIARPDWCPLTSGRIG